MAIISVPIEINWQKNLFFPLVKSKFKLLHVYSYICHEKACLFMKYDIYAASFEYFFLHLYTRVNKCAFFVCVLQKMC